MTQTQSEEHLRELVGRIFTDQKFAQQLEFDPENALRQAGISLTEPQREAIQAGARNKLAVPGAGEAVAAFVSPVGTRRDSGDQTGRQRCGVIGGRRREKVISTQKTHN